MFKIATKALLGATVLAFSIGSAVAAEPVEKMSIMPLNVQPMAAAELDSVRGMWTGPNPGGKVIEWSPNRGRTIDCPPGLLRKP